MKRLMLVRHAKTESLMDAESDFERQLKKRGHKDARLVSDHLIGKLMVPDLIISSPAARALQTARIMAGAFNIPEADIVENPLIYDGFSVDDLLDSIAKVAADENSVMVVGHNPDIPHFAVQLTGDNFFHFPTSSTVIVGFSVSNWSDIKARHGRTELFVYPKKLKSNKEK
jgi:phosphohistidine phosphatase